MTRSMVWMAGATKPRSLDEISKQIADLPDDHKLQLLDDLIRRNEITGVLNSALPFLQSLSAGTTPIPISQQTVKQAHQVVTVSLTDGLYTVTADLIPVDMAFKAAVCVPKKQPTVDERILLYDSQDPRVTRIAASDYTELKCPPGIEIIQTWVHLVNENINDLC